MGNVNNNKGYKAQGKIVPFLSPDFEAHKELEKPLEPLHIPTFHADMFYIKADKHRVKVYGNKQQ